MQRPIPPRPTQFFQPEDYDETRRTTTNNLQNSNQNHSPSQSPTSLHPIEKEPKGVHPCKIFIHHSRIINQQKD